MRITRLYADDQGESHFEDIEVPLQDGGSIGCLSEPVSVSSLVFRETPADYDYGWHTAPRRQYIIMLDAGVEITASDGETRVIRAGEILLVEDTTGRGHLSRSVNRQARHSVFIAL